MKMRKKGWATAVLAVSAIGAAGFGYISAASGDFFSGLLAHGFIAATIGGLADWFAVTAIFRKPLGISYKTDILRRNRPRIMRSLAEFVGGDLLSREHIMDGLSEQDFFGMIERYLLERGGRERLFALSDIVFTHGIETLDEEMIAKTLEPFIHRVFSDIKLGPLTDNALMTVLSEDMVSRIIKALAPLARQVWDDEGIQAILLRAIGEIRGAYVGDQTLRASLFDMEEMADERLLDHLNEYVGNWLRELEDGTGEAYERLSGWTDEFLKSPEQRMRIVSAIQKWQEERIEEFDIMGIITRGLNLLRERWLLTWRQQMREYMDSKINYFLFEKENKGRFNEWVLRWFDNLLAKHHSKLPDMMEHHLKKMTDDELIELAETRVADDLQMIRINGAIVGSLVGMLLYLLTRAAERMWS